MWVNETKRPIRSNGLGWSESCDTRLNDGTTVAGHDDLDCLDDLTAAGYIEQIGTMVNPCTKLTKVGTSIVNRLRKHKADGGQYSMFRI